MLAFALKNPIRAATSSRVCASSLQRSERLTTHDPPLRFARAFPELPMKKLSTITDLSKLTVPAAGLHTQAYTVSTTQFLTSTTAPSAFGQKADFPLAVCL